LLASAAAFRTLKRAAEFGLSADRIGFDFSKVIDRKDWIVSQITGPRLRAYLEKQGIDIIDGNARFISKNEVEVDGKSISFDKAIIATGSTPFVPPVEGLDDVGYITSDEAINMRNLPESIIVVGGSAVGLEFSVVYESFESKVTIVEAAPRIAFREDAEVSNALHNYMSSRGVTIYTSAQVKRAFRDNHEKALIIETPEGEVTLKARELFIATGRRAVTDGLNLEEIGIRTGNLAALNALSDEKVEVDFRVIPRATWSYPEMASVGITEEEAKEKNIHYITYKFPFAGLARAFADGERLGFVKVIADLDSNEVIGFHIIGHQADEMLHEGIIAMQSRITVAELAQAIHLELTMSEGVGDAFIDLNEVIKSMKREAA
jgi:dihydrolipoamide dehydrogenase